MTASRIEDRGSSGRVGLYRSELGRWCDPSYTMCHYDRYGRLVDWRRVTYVPAQVSTAVTDWTGTWTVGDTYVER